MLVHMSSFITLAAYAWKRVKRFTILTNIVTKLVLTELTNIKMS